MKRSRVEDSASPMGGKKNAKIFSNVSGSSSSSSDVKKESSDASVWDQMRKKFTNGHIPQQSMEDAHVVLSNGVEYPVVGFGTFHLKGTDCTTACETALDAGYRLVDTAAVYENEKTLKNTITTTKKGMDDACIKPVYITPATASKDMERYAIDRFVMNDDITSSPYAHTPFIQTKLWKSGHGRANALKSTKEQLKNLGLLRPGIRGKDPILRRPLDSMLIHYPGPKRGWPLKNNPDGTPGVNPPDWNGFPTRMATWTALEDLYLDKRIRVIGLCNYSLRQLKEIFESNKMRVQPMVLQMEFHPFLVDSELMKFCEEKNVLIQAYASLGGTEKVKKDASNSLTHNAIIKRVASEVGRTPGQVLLRWALQRGVAIIPKSSKAERIKENAALFNFALSTQQMNIINEMNNGTRLTWKGVDPDTEK